jgi:hypothetical protein
MCNDKTKGKTVSLRLKVFPYVVKIAMHLFATFPLASQLPDFAVLIDC